MPVMFLDFDGVLHPEFCHESRHFECNDHLLDACRGRDDLEIVISSTWRNNMALSALKVRLPEALARRVVGVTAPYATLQDLPAKVMPFEREAECLGWMRANRPGHIAWVAVDDRAWLFRPFCVELFLVSGKTGLNAEAGGKLFERLQRL
ncbi:hypothetical protein ASE28_17675 [Acidovorax sp. Root219]|nr:hypothetical protein ASE28_17675 [Acidovorax sp. Root219]